MAWSRAQVALSTRLMNVCLAALCRGGWLDRAESVLVDAIRLGLPPDVVAYNTLLNAHCPVAGLDAALAVVHRMREAGVRPDAVTYNSLITGANRSGGTVRALDLFDEMLRSGIAPDSWSYNALMHCLFRSGHPEHAYRVFADMAEKGVAPCGATTYNMLLDRAVQGWSCDKCLQDVQVAAEVGASRGHCNLQHNDQRAVQFRQGGLCPTGP